MSLKKGNNETVSVMCVLVLHQKLSRNHWKISLESEFKTFLTFFWNQFEHETTV